MLSETDWLRTLSSIRTTECKTWLSSHSAPPERSEGHDRGHREKIAYQTDLWPVSRTKREVDVASGGGWKKKRESHEKDYITGFEAVKHHFRSNGSPASNYAIYRHLPDLL